jgi:hypothetical protein
VKIKTPGHINLSIKMGKGNVSGLPAIILQATDDVNAVEGKKFRDREFLARFVGKTLSCENADEGGYRRLRVRGAGKDDMFILQANDENDKAFLDRMVGMALMCEDADEDGVRRIIVRPDPALIGKPRPTEKFTHLSLDDLLDTAARKGLNVPRNILRSDLEQIIALADEDPAKARLAAAEAKPALNAGRYKQKKNKQGVSGGDAQVTTFNE